MIPNIERVITRFWSKVDKRGHNDCWLWKAARDKIKGYGLFWFQEIAETKAHRASWFLANGTLPDDMCVLHSCDNPPCVNPAHLHLGTNEDNVREKVERGRTAKGAKGETNKTAKLKDEQVKEILIALLRGETPLSIATRYGISRRSVYAYRLGDSYGHISVDSAEVQ